MELVIIINEKEQSDFLNFLAASLHSHSNAVLTENRNIYHNVEVHLPVYDVTLAFYIFHKFWLTDISHSQPYSLSFTLICSQISVILFDLLQFH